MIVRLYRSELFFLFLSLFLILILILWPLCCSSYFRSCPAFCVCGYWWARAPRPQLLHLRSCRITVFDVSFELIYFMFCFLDPRDTEVAFGTRHIRPLNLVAACFTYIFSSDLCPEYFACQLVPATFRTGTTFGQFARAAPHVQYILTVTVILAGLCCKIRFGGCELDCA